MYQFFFNYLKLSSVFQKSRKKINDKTMETGTFHLAELFLSDQLQAVTSPAGHDDWELAVGC